MPVLCYITPELTLPFHTPLSTKSSQLFNKWDKAIPVRTRAATSALSSFPLCTSHQPYNCLSFRFPTDFHLCNLSASACSACWSIPLRSQHSLCHGAALESDSVDVHQPSYFNCRTTLLAASKELIRLCNSSLLISTEYGFTSPSSFTSR